MLSDTHSPRFWKRCPRSIAEALDGVDAILHAGDVCTVDTLMELQAWAPVHAVVGNNDGPEIADWGAPETLQIELAGLAIAMIHDSGPAQGRAHRLRQMFPDASLVIFGHSHIPWDETVAGQRILNPGSPTNRRRQPHGTMGELVIDDGVLISARNFAVT